MKPKFSGKDFEVQFTQWEATLSKYESETNSLLPDAVKVAILLNETHGPLQQHLRLNTTQTTAYAQIRQNIVDYHRSRHTYSQGNVSTPMDVDAFTTKGKKGKGKKGKGKGDYHSKGDSNSKGSNNYENYNSKGSKNQKGNNSNYKGSKGQKGTTTGTTNKGKSKGKGNLHCTHCGKTGHTVDSSRPLFFAGH